MQESPKNTSLDCNTTRILPIFDPRSPSIKTTDLLTNPPHFSPRITIDQAIREAERTASSQTTKELMNSIPGTQQTTQQHGQVVDSSSLARESSFPHSSQADLQDQSYLESKQQENPSAQESPAPNLPIGSGISPHW